MLAVHLCVAQHWHFDLSIIIAPNIGGGSGGGKIIGGL